MSCPITNKLREILIPIFGDVGTGIHSYRIYNIAYLDYLVTIVSAYIIQKILFKDTGYYFVLFGLFLTGIVVHRVLNIRTTLDKYLFPNVK